MWTYIYLLNQCGWLSVVMYIKLILGSSSGHIIDVFRSIPFMKPESIKLGQIIEVGSAMITALFEH